MTESEFVPAWRGEYRTRSFGERTKDWNRVWLAVLALILIAGAFQSFRKWQAGADKWDLFFGLCGALGGVGLAASSILGW